MYNQSTPRSHNGEFERVFVTTLDRKKDQPGFVDRVGSFFTIYKKGQGKWVRWGTVASMATVMVLGVYWLVTDGNAMGAMSPLARVIAGLVWVLIWAPLTFWMVNSIKLGEFMIMTESEMRKVTWPNRKEVSSSTKVVILLTLLLGALLWLVDMGFVQFFKAIGLS